MYTKAQLEQLWMAAGGSSATADTASAIALAESSGNASATNVNTNGSTDYGLWQINSSNFSGLGVSASNVTDPATNAAAAVALYNQSGFGNWTTYTSGAYAQYLENSVANGNAAPAIAAVAQTTTNALKLLQNLILSSQVDILTKTIILCGILILFGAIPQTSKFALWITLGAIVLLMVQQDGTGPTNTTYVTNSSPTVGGVIATATYS